MKIVLVFRHEFSSDDGLADFHLLHLISLEYLQHRLPIHVAADKGFSLRLMYGVLLSKQLCLERRDHHQGQ